MNRWHWLKNVFSKNIGVAMGIIGSNTGSVDGGTMIFVSEGSESEREDKKKEHEILFEKTAAQIKPSNRKVSDLEHYLLTHYQATVEEMNETHKGSLKYNVMASFYPQLVPQLPELIVDEKMSKRKMLKLAKKHIFEFNKIQQNVIATSYRDLDFEFRCYRLTIMQNENEIVFRVEIERTTGYVNAGYSYHSFEMNEETQKKLNVILKDIQLYLGVSQKDIEERSVRFKRYVEMVVFHENKVYRCYSRKVSVTSITSSDNSK